MDFDSLRGVPQAVAEIARYSDCTEWKWRRRRETLALESKEKQRVRIRGCAPGRAHVGYYIIDRGFPALASRVGYRPRFIDRLPADHLEQRG